MVFLDPKTDIVFKKLFGDSAYKNIAISFLNSILNRKESEIIVDVVMNDPHNFPETLALISPEELKLKSSVVDVRCTDQANRRYIVEMQVIRQEDYLERAQYYSALGLARQLRSRSEYEELEPVIFVGVLDFAILKNPRYLSHHLILDKDTYEHEFKHLELHIIELKKFNKKIEELTALSDKWIYFLQNAEDLQTIPDALNNPDMQDAFQILNKNSWSLEQLELYDRTLDEIRLQKSRIRHSREGGLTEGEAKGLAKGKAEGKLEEKINIAKQLLAFHDVATISQITGLSAKEVEELKNNTRV